MAEEDSILTGSVIKQGLGLLGKHPINLSHSYLELNLTNKKLVNIDSITQYPSIIYLDISNNLIEDIECLSSMTCLTHLNARFQHL